MSSNRSIKIVFVLTTLDFGGTERQFLETVRRLDRQYFQVNVLTFSSNGRLRQYIDALNIPVTSLEYRGIPGKFHLESYVLIYRLLRDMVRYLSYEKPDIMQSYLFWGNIYGTIAAKIAGVPVIFTGRRETLEARYKKFSKRWLQNISNLFATKVIANSKIVREKCLAQERFLTPEKIQVIYNGIELEQYSGSLTRTALREALGISEASLVIGIVARLHSRKGHHIFLQAAALVRNLYSKTLFVIVGRDQGIQANLEMLAENLNIRDAVIFTGERKDISELIALFDLQVSASFIEGLSNAILEGMASGKPVIATNIDGNPELVIHEHTGLLIPPNEPMLMAEAIIHLLRNPDLREKYGKAGRQRVANLFRIETMIHRIEELYQQCV